MLNYYADGSKFITKHHDSPILFGPEPVIINLSIGATRTLQINNVPYTLSDNTVLIMSGPSQEHELLTCDTEDPRYSFTFRNHLSLI